MNQRVFEYLWLDTNLRKALDNDQLVIHYQPKVTWRGEVRSLEALVRWQSPERGLIPPQDFIAYAEESGLIVPWDAGLCWMSCVRSRNGAIRASICVWR
jgi:cyclic di-GMP phosphodiesterase Gmr